MRAMKMFTVINNAIYKTNLYFQNKCQFSENYVKLTQSSHAMDKDNSPALHYTAVPHWQCAIMTRDSKPRVRHMFAEEDAYFTMKASSLKQIFATVAIFVCVQFFNFFSQVYNTIGVFFSSLQSFLPLPSIRINYFLLLFLLRKLFPLTLVCNILKCLEWQDSEMRLQRPSNKRPIK